MNRLSKAVAVPFLALTLCAAPALAQEHHDDAHSQDHHDKQVRHDDWKKGGHIRADDWNRGRRVDDWRAHHFRRPPKGYEWREIDGYYVLANPGGVIIEVHIM